MIFFKLFYDRIVIVVAVGVSIVIVILSLIKSRIAFYNVCVLLENTVNYMDLAMICTYIKVDTEAFRIF